MIKTLGMWTHWAAIGLLCGGPLWGMTQSDDPAVQFIAAFIISVIAMLIAQEHAGRWDEFFDILDGLEAQA